jgi:hypothetical protein
VVYEIRARERSAARGNARVRMQREAMHGVEMRVGSKDAHSESGNTTNSWLGVLSTDALVTGPLHADAAEERAQSSAAYACLPAFPSQEKADGTRKLSLGLVRITEGDLTTREASQRRKQSDARYT